MVPPQKLHITAAVVGCYAVRKQLCVATDRGTLYDMRSGPAQSETHVRTHGQLLGFRAEVCLLAGPRIMGAAHFYQPAAIPGSTYYEHTVQLYKLQI